MRIDPLRFSVALVAMPSLAFAQIESDGTPAAILGGLRTEAVPVEFVQPPDVGALLAEDEARTEAGPLRYGALMPVSINMIDNGVWDEMEDGTLVWRMKILSPGAHSIGLEFDDFWLPEGAEIFLYNDTLERVHGAYTSINNQPHEEIQFAPFPGDSVIFEYVHPPQADELARLNLGTVIYDYKNLELLEAQLIDQQQETLGGVGAGGCDINANCPEADPWELQKRSVVRTVSGGGLCTAFLVNNTSADQTRYVLSAWHCGQSNNTVFRFNYQTSTCTGGGAPQNQQVSGATQLVSNQASDGRLMRINNTIPSNYNPFFAGWSRSTTNPNFGFCFHHPGGSPKQYAFDNNGLTKQTVFIGGIGSVPSWRAFFSEGTTEGGSSGSPIFDQNGRARGSLSGGPLGTCQPEGFWGRLNVFWSNTNIAQFLDPTGTGLTAIDGLDPNDPDGGGGPGGTVPEITSTTPTSISAVNPVSPVVVTLNGSGFENATSVEVNGTPLIAFPPQFTIVNDSTMNVTLQPPYDIGTININVIEGAANDSVDLPVTFNITPTIDLINSDPGFILTALPIEVYMGSLPNDSVFLLLSGSNTPSSLPGIFDADIGAGLTNLFLVNNFVINPATGSAKAEIPVSGLPIGTKLYFQAGVISALFPSLPLDMSNVESGTVLF